MRLAVLGCGAAAELLHLPAVRHVPDVQVSVLVDRDLARARALAARFGVGRVERDYSGIGLADADAVLVALPNRLHASVAIEFLARGLHVLVEKPMAMNATEARAMVEAAARSSAVLQVGFSKRFSRGAQLIKDAIVHGALGSVSSVTVTWGVRFDWPLASDAGMAGAEAGGGVLVDFGSHFLDLLCWWFGVPDVESYADDASGGVEADCELSLTLPGPAGRVPASMRLSRLRALENVVRIVGDRFALEWMHETPGAVQLRPTAWPGEALPAFAWSGGALQSHLDVFVDQLRAFVDGVGRGQAAVSGASALTSMELIERCYAVRRAVVYPWEKPVAMPARRLVSQ